MVFINAFKLTVFYERTWEMIVNSSLNGSMIGLASSMQLSILVCETRALMVAGGSIKEERGKKRRRGRGNRG